MLEHLLTGAQLSGTIKENLKEAFNICVDAEKLLEETKHAIPPF
jgi:hypothetical protein